MAQEGGGRGGGGGSFTEEQRVGDHVLHLLTAPPVPAVSRQRQQGAVWTCRDIQYSGIRHIGGVSGIRMRQLEERGERTDRQTDGTVAVGWMLS